MTSSAQPTAQRRLVLAGKGSIACEVLNHAHRMLAKPGLGWTLAGMATRGDPGHDTWEPSFAARCRALDVPLIDKVASAGLGPHDLFLSLQFDRIVRIPELGGAAAYNLHFSALPRHRGCYPGMWALRSGDAQAGVSLHVLTAGIDDGPVVDQTLIPLEEHTTARTLYDEMHRCGAALVQRHLADLLEGRAQATAQDTAQATYHDRHSIDFQQRELPYEAMDVASCSRLARSLIFPPFQYPTVQGRSVVMCEILHTAVTSPESGPDTRLLRCLDGWLRVQLTPEHDAARAPT